MGPLQPTGPRGVVASRVGSALETLDMNFLTAGAAGTATSGYVAIYQMPEWPATGSTAAAETVRQAMRDLGHSAGVSVLLPVADVWWPGTLLHRFLARLSWARGLRPILAPWSTEWKPEVWLRRTTTATPTRHRREHPPARHGMATATPRPGQGLVNYRHRRAV